MADVGSAQNGKKSFILVSKEGIYNLAEEEFSFTIRYQYHSTEIKPFSSNRCVVLQRPSSF